MKNSEICVPAAALHDADESGQAVAPGEGDEVEVRLRGPVTRSEGGNIYFTPNTANDHPMTAAAPEKSQDDEDEEMRQGLKDLDGGFKDSDDNVRGISHAANYVLAFLLVLAGLLVGGNAGAQNIDLSWSKRKSVSASPTTNVVFINNFSGAGLTNAMQVFYVEQLNLSGAAGFSMLFDSFTNQLANATPQVCPKAVAAGANVAHDFGPNGAPFYNGINVCLSQTPNSLTNAVGGGYVSIVWSPLQR